ncbi:MAG: sigma-70 family RNA polymerase sigma factor [Raineya sp.]|nr:sigma-70 family RNA polymerase sigma factor [Raineya sp.]MDW8296433.1 sigma-70 family RNA polymerase sigma factor [Raineya sp.]
MIFLKVKKYQNLSDEALLEEFCQKQDMNLLGILYERYMTLLYGLCLKYFKEREQAKDMVMQIFEKLTQKVLHAEIKHFKSWLYVFARNECLMTIRKQNKIFLQEFWLDNEDENVESLPFFHLTDEEEIDTESKLQLLEKGLETLSEEQKICITLFYLQKKSYQEICEHTGYEINKVKSYIQNGKRNLRIFMEKNGFSYLAWVALLMDLL